MKHTMSVQNTQHSLMHATTRWIRTQHTLYNARDQIQNIYFKQPKKQKKTKTEYIYKYIRACRCWCRSCTLCIRLLVVFFCLCRCSYCCCVLLLLCGAQNEHWAAAVCWCVEWACVWQSKLTHTQTLARNARSPVANMPIQRARFKLDCVYMPCHACDCVVNVMQRQVAYWSGWTKWNLLRSYFWAHQVERAAAYCAMQCAFMYTRVYV